jgi:hypothetical protein
MNRGGAFYPWAVAAGLQHGLTESSRSHANFNGLEPWAMTRCRLAIATSVIAGLLASILATATLADTLSSAIISAESTSSSQSPICDSMCATCCESISSAISPCGCNSGGDCSTCCDGDGCYYDITTRRLYGNYYRLNDPYTMVGGWIDGGIMGNNLNPVTHFNGPVTFADRDNGQLNQFYGVLRRTTDLSQNSGLFVGGQVDFFFGSDSFFTRAAGLEGTRIANFPRWNSDRDFLYGYSMPQLYAETDYNDLRIKWGHFYTILGYEVIPSIGNFFYTHSYALQYGQPFTHTGMLASRTVNNWTWNAGVVAGWNDFALQDGAQFLGGLTYTNPGTGSLAFSIVSGNQGAFNIPGIGPTSNRTTYSLVWTRNLASRWTYVLHHSLGTQSNTLGFNALDSRRASWYGINQYLFYQLNNCWSVGGRLEWFDDPQGYLVTGLRPGNTDARFRFPGSFYETSLGVNYKPTRNFIFRGELRYDWTTAQAGFFAPAIPGFPPNQPFGDNTHRSQFLFGGDAIYLF